MNTKSTSTLDHLVSSQKQLKVINKFAQALMQRTTSDDLIQYVVKEVVGQSGFVDCVIYLFDTEKELLFQHAALGDKLDVNLDIINAITIPLGKGITGKVALTHKPIIIPDTRKEKEYITDIKPMLSELCVPIIQNGQFFGVIDCEHPKINHFTDSHLKLLESIASMLATRLAQWELMKELEKAEDNISKIEVKFDESEEKYRLLFELSEDPMMMMTQNKFEICNDSAARVFKYKSKEEMQNIHPSEASPKYQPDGQSSFTKAEEMMGLAITNGFHKFDWEHKKKDGQCFPMEVTLTKMPYREQVAIFAVCRDISERKRYQEDLKHAVEKANNANIAKSKFLANMSHELRTPLNAILGFSKMMKDGIFGPLGNKKYSEYANDINDSGKYLLNLISDILDISAIDASERTLNIEIIHIESLISNCLVLIQTRARKKELIITSKVADAAHFLNGDERGLKQIFINLLTNSVKFTPHGGSIEISVIEENNAHIFILKDTGIGIPANRISSITDRFDRGDIDGMKTMEGTGLGLAIVKSIIDLHNGSLKIESVENEGTTITFSIPKISVQ